MVRWLVSALVAGITLHLVLTADIVRQWSERPRATVAAFLDATSVYLDSSSVLRRDRLASVERIADFSTAHPIRKLSAAIGMLSVDFERADGSRDSYNCTAALIWTDLAITNRHCVIHGNDKAVEMTLWLDHTAEDTATIIELETVPLESDAALDYALLRVRALPGAAPRFDLSGLVVRAVVPGERLFIIHHSNGDPQQVSRAFCRADLDQSRAGTAISHSCPTRPGSSGALVFADSDGAIVGLHRSIARRIDIVRGFATPLTAIFAKSQIFASKAAAR